MIVGVESYNPGIFNNLKYAAEDAHSLGEALKEYGYRITVLTSQSTSAMLKPYNAENIRTAIKSRVNSCAEGDTLIVSLSGHGIQFKDEDELSSGVKETYFCPSNADLADKSTLIPISEIIDLLKSCEASRKLLLVDSCRNEVISKIGQNKSSDKKIELKTVHEGRRSVPKGMSVLFSCTNGQFSWESNELKRSVFSYFVTKYLNGDADRRFYDKGKLSLDDMVAYVRKKTNDYVFENNLSNDGQYPVMRGESANWHVAVAEPLNNYRRKSHSTIERHAKLGIALAQVKLGNLYDYGRGVKQDYKEAMRWYRLAAEQENATGQCNIAFLYYNGDGVAQDYMEALKWYRLAAKQGSARAQYNIGNFYRKGHGVSQDYKEAMKWFRLSAEQGYAAAQSNIGFLYREGQGVAQDEEKAMRWYRLAAEQGNAAAQSNIGYLYHYGIGVAKDYKKAMKWYRLAADQGNAAAQSNVGTLYSNGQGVAQDYREAMKWYRLAAEQGVAEAQLCIGGLYALGQGAVRDYKEAMKWWRLAAEQGDAKAQLYIGDFHKYGLGVARDPSEARKWYQKAAANGDDDAKKRLKELDDD